MNEMNVKELKEALTKFPDDMDVFVAERVTEFTYGLVNGVTSREIDFVEEIGDEPLSRGEVVIISEE